MDKFTGLHPKMRVEVLIDPETGDYQLIVDGDINIIKAALNQVLEQLEDEEIIASLSSDPLEIDV